MIHNLGIFLMNCLLLSDWGSTGEHNRYLTNRKAKQQELAGNWATRSQRPWPSHLPVCTSTCFLPSTGSGVRGRSCSWARFLATALFFVSWNFCTCSSMACPRWEWRKRAYSLETISQSKQSALQSDSWGEAKRPASWLLSSGDLGMEMSLALCQVTTKVSDKAQKQLESSTMKWNK